MIKKLFSLSHKIGRKTFLFKSIMLGTLLAIFYRFICICEEIHSYLLLTIFTIAFILVLICSFILLKQRLNDLCLSWKWMFLYFIPIANTFFGLYLMFTPGKESVDYQNNDFINRHKNDI